MTVDTPLLTVAEAAGRMNVDPRTIRRAIERPVDPLPAVDLTPDSTGRTWRIHPEELAAWLERRRNTPRVRHATDIPMPAAPAPTRHLPVGAGVVAVTPEMGR